MKSKTEGTGKSGMYRILKAEGTGKRAEGTEAEKQAQGCR